jgi:pimeloyl-ACP methyl ester carboxylesterase
VFRAAGYAPLTPGWPDDPNTVAEAKANPEVFADKTIGEVADHYEDVAKRLITTPVVVGHSFGGLLAQILAGRGVSAVTVAIEAR